MFCFLRIYFILLFSVALGVSVSAAVQETAPGGRLYMLDYEDVALSPRAKVVDLGERMKRLARQIIPVTGENREVREVYIELAGKNKQPRFGIRTDRKNNFRITLPDNYSELLAEPDGVLRLMSWIVLARIGAPPEQESRIRYSWFITGMARKVLGEMTPGKTPFSGYFPAAYALTSYDVYPSLEALIATPLEPSDTAPRLLYEEYCELFLLICARNGLFRSTMMADLLGDTLRNPSSPQYPIFKKYVLELLSKKEKHLFTEESLKQPDPVLNEWFHKELNRLLNLNFLPASAQKVELAYNAAIRFSCHGKPDQKKEIQGGIGELTESWDKLRDPEKISDAMADRVAGVMRIVSPDLRVSLREVWVSLMALRQDHSPAALRRVQESNSAFYRALERNIALEKLLSDTERDCVSPAARYYLTFGLIGFSRHSFGQPLKPLMDFLDEKSRNAGEF